MNSDLFETNQLHLNESASVKSSTTSSESCTEVATAALHPGQTTPDAKASSWQVQTSSQTLACLHAAAAILGQLIVKPDAASVSGKSTAHGSASTSTSDGVEASTPSRASSSDPQAAPHATAQLRTQRRGFSLDPARKFSLRSLPCRSARKLLPTFECPGVCPDLSTLSFQQSRAATERHATIFKRIQLPLVGNSSSSSSSSSGIFGNHFVAAASASSEQLSSVFRSVQQWDVFSDRSIQNTTASNSHAIKTLVQDEHGCIVPDSASEVHQDILDIPFNVGYEYTSSAGSELYLLGAPTEADDASSRKVRNFAAACDTALDALITDNVNRYMADKAAREECGYTSDCDCDDLYSDRTYNCMSLRDWTTVLKDYNDIDQTDTETCSSDNATVIAVRDDVVAVTDTSSIDNDTGTTGNSSIDDDEQSTHQFWLDNAAAAFSSDPTATARWTPVMCTALNSAVKQLKSMCDTTVVNTADIDWELIALVLTYTKVCSCYILYIVWLIVCNHTQSLIVYVNVCYCSIQVYCTTQTAFTSSKSGLAC
jgi:hypothetical protein